tara:strand:+ start:35682 stop:36800 length:1119 start_codon:yes stop_codon:yes gene_type:complete
MIANPAEWSPNKHRMFWATVILSVGSLSGAVPAQGPQLHAGSPVIEDHRAGETGVFQDGFRAGLDRSRKMAIRAPEADRIRPDGKTEMARVSTGQGIVQGGQDAQDDLAEAAGLPEVSARNASGSPLFSLTHGRSMRPAALQAATDLNAGAVSDERASASALVPVFFKPGRGPNHDVEGQAMPGNTVARVVRSRILAFKPQIERLCRYVEEQSRRGSTSVGHEKTHPRSKRSGNLPSSGDFDQFRKRGSTPILCQEPAGGSGGLRSFRCFGALYAVRKALPLYGEEGRAEQREAASGNRKSKAGEGYPEKGDQEIRQVCKEEKRYNHRQQEGFEEKLRDLIPGNGSLEPASFLKGSRWATALFRFSIGENRI